MKCSLCKKEITDSGFLTIEKKQPVHGFSKLFRIEICGNCARTISKGVKKEDIFDKKVKEEMEEKFEGE